MYTVQSTLGCPVEHVLQRPRHVYVEGDTSAAHMTLLDIRGRGGDIQTEDVDISPEV